MGVCPIPRPVFVLWFEGLPKREGFEPARAGYRRWSEILLEDRRWPGRTSNTFLIPYGKELMANVSPEVISPPDSAWREYIQRGSERGVQGRIIESWQRCGRVGLNPFDRNIPVPQAKETRDHPVGGILRYVPLLPPSLETRNTSPIEIPRSAPLHMS